MATAQPHRQVSIGDLGWSFSATSRGVIRTLHAGRIVLAAAPGLMGWGKSSCYMRQFIPPACGSKV